MIGIINYGLGNLRSVLKAVEKLGFSAKLVSEKEELSLCHKLILPGVGAFGHGVSQLEKTGLKQALLEEIEKGKHVLGICLGFQLLFEKSDESVGDGLGIIPGTVVKFEKGKKVPQIGWNSIKINSDPIFHGIKQDSDVYFVHSFLVKDTEAKICTTSYQENFVSGVKCKNLYGFQFHPEKSGDVGLKILENFLNL